MAAVVEEVMDHQQECDRYDRLQRLEDPEELIFWTAVNCYQEKEWEALDWEGRKEDREEGRGRWEDKYVLKKKRNQALIIDIFLFVVNGFVLYVDDVWVYLSAA